MATPVSQSRASQAPTSSSLPQAGWIKINVDGSLNSATNLGGVGAVFRDEAGSYAGGFVRQIHASSPTMVELLTVRDGLCWTMQRNLLRIILESDSLQVVQAIGSLQKGSSHMNLLVEDICVSIWRLEASQICHIRRFANVATYRMTKLVNYSNSVFCW